MSLIYKGQNLFVDNISVKSIAKSNVTPFYVYSYKRLKGIANQYGREVSDVSYRKIGQESEGMIAVHQGSQWLNVDTLGNIYKTKNRKLKIQTAGDFGEDIAPIRAGNVWGYVNAEYDTIIKFIYK